MKKTLTLLLSALLMFGALVPRPGPVAAAPSDDLYAAINTYRQGLGLTAIPLSPQLTAVAQAHVQDLIANSTTDPNYTGAGCVPHGWSSQGQWTGGCYKFEDPSTFPIMWNKPREIANYPGDGFEILFGSNGGTATASAALQAWQADPPHNDVIVNQGIWQSHPWQAVGVWVEGGWAAVWFGEVADPNATQPVAQGAGAPAAPAQVAPPPAAPDANNANTTANQANQPADTTGNAATQDGQGNQPATNTQNGNTTTDTTGGTGTGDTTAQANTTGAPTTGTANQPQGAATNQACGDAEEVAFLALINDYRAANGLGPLAMSPTLTSAARGHSQDMATKNYFDHVGLDGSTFSQRIAAAGYPGGTTAENIFAGDEHATGAMESWKNSPPHNANMLNPAYTAIGIGRAFDPNSQFGWYWTTTFGDVVDAACGGAAAQPAGGATTTDQGQPATNDQTTQPGTTNAGQNGQNGTTDNGQNGTTGNGQDGGTTNDDGLADRDGDGLPDDQETAFFGTNPDAFDTDGGGVGDGDEVLNGTDPLNPADDNGGAQANNNPNADTDGDGVSDSDELLNGTDPFDPNSF